MTHIDGFRCVKNIPSLMKISVENNIEESDEEYFPEVDIQYPEKVHDLQNDLSFLPERMKIETVEKLA